MFEFRLTIIIPTDLPFQFPLKIALAMTIYEAQRQTFGVAGIYLEKICMWRAHEYPAHKTIMS